MVAALLWMGALTAYDIRRRRLPNWLTLPGFAVIMLVAAGSGHGPAAALGAGLLAALPALQPEQPDGGAGHGLRREELERHRSQPTCLVEGPDSFPACVALGWPGCNADEQSH